MSAPADAAGGRNNPRAVEFQRNSREPSRMRHPRSSLSRRIAVIAIAAALAWWGTRERAAQPSAHTTAPAAWQQLGDPVQAAFLARSRDVQVESEGTVERILPDDTNGARHQRFILKGPSGRTVLVAHNIDLAPRVEGLERGARVVFNGEYEWNERGGVIHWTHRAPRGDHRAGWIEYRGRRYQ